MVGPMAAYPHIPQLRHRWDAKAVGGSLGAPLSPTPPALSGAGTKAGGASGGRQDSAGRGGRHSLFKAGQQARRSLLWRGLSLHSVPRPALVSALRAADAGQPPRGTLSGGRRFP
jgi:hypothetical protein